MTSIGCDLFCSLIQVRPEPIGNLAFRARNGLPVFFTESPLGTLVIVTDEQGVLSALDIGSRAARLGQKLPEVHGPHELVVVGVT